MNPPAIPGTRTRRVATNGVELVVTEAGERGAPLVVLAHGFPELAHSWRHQIPVLVEAGYHVLAPDQRGYGDSSHPTSVEDYDILALSDDLLGLLDDVGAEQAHFVGHDWGSMVVWHVATRVPERVGSVVGMSVPFTPRPEVPPTSLMRQVFGDGFFYMLYFQDPGVADADLGADPRRTLTGMLAGIDGSRPLQDLAGLASSDPDLGFVDRLPRPESLPAWLPAEDLDRYVDAFSAGGFTGPINWYRNFDRNWERTEDLAGAHVGVPALFITGANDPVAVMAPAAVMDGWVDDLRGTVVIDGAGHWVQQEKPDEVNAALMAFLRSLDTPSGG